MKYRILNFGAALSMVCITAIVVLWARTYWQADSLSLEMNRPIPGGSDYFCYAATTASGGLCLSLRQGTFGIPDASAKRAITKPTLAYTHSSDTAYRVGSGEPSLWTHIGFHYSTVRWWHRGTIDASSFVTLPLWSLVLLGLLLPGIRWLAILRKKRRATLNRCPQCSYDLRAHKPGDKCPECGTPIPAKSDL